MLRHLCLLLALLPFGTPVTTLRDMEQAVVQLDAKMRAIGSKLHRHESRTRQMDGVSAKTLQAIVTQMAGQSRNVDSIAVHMAKMEGRLARVEQSLAQTDQRLDEIISLLRDKERQTPDVSSSVSTDAVVGKLDTMNGEINQRLTSLLSEALTSRETVTSHLERQDGMMNDLSNSLGSVSGFKENVQQTGARLQETEAKLSKHVQDAGEILTQFSVGVAVLIDNAHRLENDSRLVADDVSQLRGDFQRLEQHMENRQIELFNSHYQTGQSEDLYSQIKTEMDLASNHTNGELDKLRREIRDISEQTSGQVTDRIISLQSGQEELSNMIQESMAMAEGLYERVNLGYDELKDELRGLSNLEAVMIDTADSVLDTKRRLEYGVQQILLEVEAAVRAQGININGTFTTKFGNISQQILTNQSIALHNMTKAIEDEIAQVWRQIGVMYQVLSSSAQTLENIDTKTTQYVNGTLEKTEKVDGTVGDVSLRVGEVEENLNFLLGRLSLVVSEFNQMKSGIGAELDLLRNNFRAFGEEADIKPPEDPNAPPRKVPIV